MALPLVEIAHDIHIDLCKEDDELTQLCEHLYTQKQFSRIMGGVDIGETPKATRVYIPSYHCALTNQPCVGATEEQYDGQKLLNPKIVQRCPSKKPFAE